MTLTLSTVTLFITVSVVAESHEVLWTAGSQAVLFPTSILVFSYTWIYTRGLDCAVKSQRIKAMKPCAFIKEAKQANLCIWLMKRWRALSQSEEPVGWGSEALYTLLSIGLRIPLLTVLVRIHPQGPFLLCRGLPRIHEQHLATLSCPA